MKKSNYVSESSMPSLFPPNLPEVFKQIYYYLYSNSNIPRAERLGAEMVRILFCKIYDEIYSRNNKEFITYPQESERNVSNRIKILFDKVKKTYANVFDTNETIFLDNKSVKYVVEKLKNYYLTKTERDVVSESFQAFWGRGLRGEKGQFFTPRNVVKMCVEILNPKPGERVIDPACGSGGFLVEVLSHLKEKSDFCNIFGIDKEIDLVKICKAYMAIIGDGHTNIFCEDSLNPSIWSEEMKEKIKDGSFDVVLTNPPFGAKIYIEDKSILKNFKLGHNWVKKDSKVWAITNLISRQVPQILFIERCLQLLKHGGRMAIVLPDGIFGNPRDKYIWQFILKNAKIMAIVSLPPETFLPSTHTKTSVLFLKKKNNNSYKIFMAIANKIGHDKNGKLLFKMDKSGNYLLGNEGERILDDDLPSIIINNKKFIKKENNKEQNHLGFFLKSSEIKNNIFIPSYYNPETKQILKSLEKTGKYELVSIQKLIDQQLISIKRGNEVGSKYYGKGNIPFVRTTDIVNWEIKIDPIKNIPEEIYEKYKNIQDIQENDILFVSDGTFLIGRTAIVTKLDKKIVIQSHIKRIRCQNKNKFHPYLLLYLFNTEIIQRQIREKTFVQATISTIGERLNEIILPVPKDKIFIKKIIDNISEIIEMKVQSKQKIGKVINFKMEK